MAQKKRPRIYIKPGKVGSFTKWCIRQGHKGVTAKCIAQGLASKNAAIRKKANFAKNSRKWRKTGSKGRG